MEYSIPKGLYDVLPIASQEEDFWRLSSRWHYVETIMRDLAKTYQCDEIRTPIFERTDLFLRGVGESTDIVTKEMYTFMDKGERFMTLRPEGTAPVIRAFVEKKLYTLSPIHKFFYLGPMFRYERPQAGRYRQHTQFGAEMIGSGLAEQDVEIIDMACELYRRLGLKELTVMVNTVGDKESRDAYKTALRDYFFSYLSSLSDESRIRFEKNILRILDSKSPEDQEAIANAPSIQNFLTPHAKQHFDTVCQLLDGLELKWQVNPRLVRGLDYYNHTVFEITSMHLGAQNALGGGGRYDGLVAMLGGPNLPSVGFATGIERLLQAMHKQDISFPETPGPFVYFIGLGEVARHILMPLVARLRHAGLSVEIDLLGRKVQQALQMANQKKAQYVLVLGEEEIASKQVLLKEMTSRQTTPLHFDDLFSQIINLHSASRGST
jgi:histidyl-tRNA synthetase